jgi:hypothetical protein
MCGSDRRNANNVEQKALPMYSLSTAYTKTGVTYLEQYYHRAEISGDYLQKMGLKVVGVRAGYIIVGQFAM